MNIRRILNTITQQDRLVDAQAEIDAIRDADSSAVCPTPEQLIATEDAGLIWNFETGQADEPNPDADARQTTAIAARYPASAASTIRIPIIGTISRGGIGVYIVNES